MKIGKKARYDAQRLPRSDQYTRNITLERKMQANTRCAACTQRIVKPPPLRKGHAIYSPVALSARIASAFTQCVTRTGISHT